MTMKLYLCDYIPQIQLLSAVFNCYELDTIVILDMRDYMPDYGLFDQTHFEILNY